MIQQINFLTTVGVPPSAIAPLVLQRDFPSVTVTARSVERMAFGVGGHHAFARARIDVERWCAPDWSPRPFDQQLLSPGRRVACIEVIGSGDMAAVRCGHQVLSRYQWRIGRRNAWSANSMFQSILSAHRDLHDLRKPLVCADFQHALDTWQWVLRLSPDCGRAIQVAALFHDVERLTSESDRRIEHLAPCYTEYKMTHARRGSAMIGPLVERIGLPPDEIARIVFLVSEHEHPRDDPDLRLLNDADALSFFSLNSPGFVDYYGPEHTATKIVYTLARMSAEARTILPNLRLRHDVAQALAGCLNR